MTKVYAGDVAVHIRLSTGVDLTDASAVAIKVRISRPLTKTQAAYIRDMEWPATIMEPADAGVIEHITAPQDLSEPGTYLIGAYVEFPDGGKYTGETAQLTIAAPFE